MIETDGVPTIASKRSDPWLQAALDAGGHLGDDVARALLEDERRSAEYPTIEVPKETIALGMALGLMRWDPKDKVHELTPKGDEWLRAYCRRKIAEHELAETLISDDPGLD